MSKLISTLLLPNFLEILKTSKTAQQTIEGPCQKCEHFHWYQNFWKSTRAQKWFETDAKDSWQFLNVKHCDQLHDTKMSGRRSELSLDVKPVRINFDTRSIRGQIKLIRQGSRISKQGQSSLEPNFQEVWEDDRSNRDWSVYS